MPHLAMTLSPDGLALTVTVGLNGPTTASLHAAGQAVSPPLTVRGLVDTGSEITCVSSRVLRHLNLAPTEQRPAQTVDGEHVVNLYDVSFSIPPVPPGRTALLTLPRLRVMEFARPVGNDVEVLIGLDVLAHCLLIYDGFGKGFTLAD